MKPRTGRCAILFPHGVLFRDEERAMREKLVEDDVIECVLGLGPNLFYNSPMEACIVVCRTSKPPERRGKMLFINAVNEVTRERAQSFLSRRPHREDRRRLPRLRGRSRLRPDGDERRDHREERQPEHPAVRARLGTAE